MQNKDKKEAKCHFYFFVAVCSEFCFRSTAAVRDIKFQVPNPQHVGLPTAGMFPPPFYLFARVSSPYVLYACKHSSHFLRRHSRLSCRA